MASIASADSKKKKAEATKAFLAAKYEKMKADRAAKAARRTELEERMAEVGLDDAQKAAARSNLRKEEASDMRESRKRLAVRDFVSVLSMSILFESIKVCFPRPFSTPPNLLTFVFLSLPPHSDLPVGRGQRCFWRSAFGKKKGRWATVGFKSHGQRSNGR
jgi:hypothetical protein